MNNSILVIDNYDSFVYNLVQYLGELGGDIAVYRNDALALDEIERLSPDRIVISPGPGRPAEAGISVPIIRHFAGRVPLLGVCLGHQAIAEAFGGIVTYAPELRHGKVSDIHHRGEGLFAGLESPFEATRYHSLVVEREGLPSCLEVTAWTGQGLIMGLRHRRFQVHGLQFHPESILTRVGMTLLKRFLCCGNSSNASHQAAI